MLHFMNFPFCGVLVTQNGCAMKIIVDCKICDTTIYSLDFNSYVMRERIDIK